MSAARSPSPGPMVRPCCGLRRSADSSPFRSAAPSTPDSPQRSTSVGRNGGRASSRAEKENDSHHHHHSRDAARTPRPDHRHCSTVGGGTKSFMAPTISAASKAVAASPSSRKKVLGERNNDPVPSSSPGDLLAHAKPRGPPPAEDALGSPRRLWLSVDGAPAAPPPPHADPTHHFASSSPGDLLAQPKTRGPQPPEEALGAPRRLWLSHDGAPAPPHPHADPTHHVLASPGELLAQAKPRGPPPTEEEVLGAPRRLRLSLDGAPSDPPPPPAAAAQVASHGARCSLGGEAWAEEAENPVCKAHHHHDEPGGVAEAPYDPKTNYLSPRPRFLRYRPNPRVEQYRLSSGRRRLEDGFAASSESSEEADTATATTGEEDIGLSSEEEQESSPLSPASDAGCEVAAGVPPQQSAPAPEPNESTAISPRARGHTHELEPVASPSPICAKNNNKMKRSSLRFLLVAPLFLISVLAAFACVPPPTGAPVVLHASLSKVSDYYLSVQEIDPVELAAWLKKWSSSSLDFVTSYWNALASSQEQEFFGPHVAANLSASAAADDADSGVGFYYSAAEIGPMPTEEEPTGSSILKQVLEIQDVVSASDPVAIDGSEVQVMAALGDGTVEDEPIDDDAEMVQESASEASVLNAEMAEEVSGSSGEEMGSFDQDLNLPFQSVPEPEDVVDDMKVPSSQKDVQREESEGDQEDHVKEDQGAHPGQKLGSNMWSGYLDEFSKPAMAGSVLAVLIVSTALGFLYMRQNGAHVSLNPNEPAETVVERESAEKVEQVEEHHSGSVSIQGHPIAMEGSRLQQSMAEKSERIGDSDASEYSSSLSSGLSSRRKGKVEQSLQSLEPMSRRESTGYSTSSYGSFTTYEKLSAKKKKKGGGCDDPSAALQEADENTRSVRPAASTVICHIGTFTTLATRLAHLPH